MDKIELATTIINEITTDLTGQPAIVEIDDDTMIDLVENWIDKIEEYLSDYEKSRSERHG